MNSTGWKDVASLEAEGSIHTQPRETETHHVVIGCMCCCWDCDPDCDFDPYTEWGEV